MAGTAIAILGKKYIFFGVGGELLDIIQQSEQTETFQEDFGVWKKWMDQVAKDDVIVVCDPYKMAGISGEELSGTTLEEIAVSKANEAAASLARELGGNMDREIARWSDTIAGIFLNYGRSRTTGAQHTNGPFLKNCAGESMRTVLFIDFTSIIREKPGLALPTIMHETTHYLEEKTFKGDTVFGAKGILCARAEDGNLWDAVNAGSLGEDEGWAKVFRNLQNYQKSNEEERMTSLVEKIAIGSLHETIDRSWIGELKSVFKTALTECNISVS